MIQMCPWCEKLHNSDDHDEGWYFVCCGHTRLVWERDAGNDLALAPVEDDMSED